LQLFETLDFQGGAHTHIPKYSCPPHPLIYARHSSPLQEKEEEEKEKKEQEFVAQRKMEELSKMEGGDQELVYNQVTTSNAAVS
jgi:hypothetical protein